MTRVPSTPVTILLTVRPTRTTASRRKGSPATAAIRMINTISATTTAQHDPGAARQRRRRHRRPHRHGHTLQITSAVRAPRAGRKCVKWLLGKLTRRLQRFPVRPAVGLSHGPWTCKLTGGRCPRADPAQRRCSRSSSMSPCPAGTVRPCCTRWSRPVRPARPGAGLAADLGLTAPESRIGALTPGRAGPLPDGPAGRRAGPDRVAAGGARLRPDPGGAGPPARRRGETCPTAPSGPLCRDPPVRARRSGSRSACCGTAARGRGGVRSTRPGPADRLDANLVVDPDLAPAPRGGAAATLSAVPRCRLSSSAGSRPFCSVAAQPPRCTG